MEVVLTIDSEKLFRELGEDACNWGGQPMIGANVEIGPDRRGNLTDLIRKGLVRVIHYEDDSCVAFTDLGKEILKDVYNITIRED